MNAGSRITGNLHGAPAPSGSISLRQSPSGSISLRQAPSGSVRVRGPPHLCPHPSTVNTPPPFQDRNAGADCPGAGCAVWDDHALLRRAATILYAHNGGVGWADGMQAHTLLWHRPCWSVLGQATIMCTALYCHGMKPGPSESSLPPSDGASPLPSGGASLPPSSSSKTTARRLGGGSSGRRSCAKAGHFTMHFH